MKNIFTLSLLLVAVMVVSCSGMRKFDRVEATSVERYSIVYKDNKCRKKITLQNFEEPLDNISPLLYKILTIKSA